MQCISIVCYCKKDSSRRWLVKKGMCMLLCQKPRSVVSRLRAVICELQKYNKFRIVSMAMLFALVSRDVVASMRRFTQPVGQRAASTAFAATSRFMSMDQARKLLNVSDSAPLAKIKANYRDKVKVAHPDQGGSDEKMKELNEAY